MSRFRKILLIIIVLVVLLAVGIHFMHRSQRGEISPESVSVPVTVVPVVRQDVPIYLSGLGTVVAYKTVTISPQVSGQLLSIHFKEGGKVKRGEWLAQIDPRRFQASYDQALANARQAQAQLDTARSRYQRSQVLLGKGYISKQDMEGLRNKVAQNKAMVAADKASIENAKLQLDHTRIISPIDGVAGLRDVDPGNVVSASTTIVTLTRIHPIYVEFNLPEQNIEEVRAALRSHKQLAVRAFNRKDTHPIANDGVLQVINNQIDTSTGTFRLRALFSNKENKLWPGQFVNVQLKVRTVRGGLVIPAEAVQRGPDGNFVYLLNPDKTVVSMREVSVGSDVGDNRVMINQGVKPGQQVVTEGQFRLKPGARVTPLKPGELPPLPTPTTTQNGAKKKHLH